MTRRTRKFLFDNTTGRLFSDTSSLVSALTAEDNKLGGSSSISQNDIDVAVAALVDSAPATLNTLNELAAALGDDANFATTITNSIATKANTSSLASVATSGSYNDLTNKPTIPSDVGDLTDTGNLLDASTLPEGMYIQESQPSSGEEPDGSLWFQPSTAKWFRGTKTTRNATSSDATLTGSYVDWSGDTAGSFNSFTMTFSPAVRVYSVTKVSGPSNSGSISSIQSTSGSISWTEPSGYQSQYYTGARVLSEADQLKYVTSISFQALYNTSYFSVQLLGAMTWTEIIPSETLLNSTYATAASPTFTGTPAAPTAAAGTNTTQIATTAFVTTAVSNLVDSAPSTLNTLNELAAALGDDANFATTITNSISSKIGLGNLSITTASPSGNGSLTYNNTSGVFTFTPADTSGGGGGGGGSEGGSGITTGKSIAMAMIFGF